jgi:hypothetical protein
LLCGLGGPAAAQAQTNIFTTIGITTADTRGNGQIYPPEDPFSLRAEGMPLSRTVTVPRDDDRDNVPLRMPDTTGTKPNLAGMNGQTFALFAGHHGPYTKLHFFGMTADGGPAGGDFTLGYSDGSTATVRVLWPDWCSGSDDRAHWAIGPIDGRYRKSGGDGAPCGIFHAPVDNPQPGKTLVSVKLPPATDPAGDNTRSYLMALTLEDADGRFKLPDLSGEVTAPGDETPPTTEHALAPTAPDGGDGWYRSPVQVTLTADDGTGGSGVEQLLYSIDGGDQQFYDGAFTVSGDGAHVVEYGAVDRAGNLETLNAVTVKVDGSGPVTAAKLTPGTPLGGGGWYDSAVTVALGATDGGGSGVSAAEYRVGAGPWTPYTAPITIADAGAHTLEYRSTDVAGNLEAPKAMPLRIDATAPVTSALINGAPPLLAYAGGARVAFARDDGEGSGATTTHYRLDEGAWTDYVGAVDVTALGAHRVDFRSVDAAGNIENFKTVTFTVTAVPQAAPGPGAQTPPAPRPRPFASIEDLDRKYATLTALRGGRATVRVACQAVDRGTLSLKVTRAVAKRHKLASTTLASRSVRCGAQGRAAVTLKPSSKVRRALARSKRSVRATLTLRFGGVRDTQTVTFSRGKS